MPGRAHKRYTRCVAINKLFLIVISSFLLLRSRYRDSKSLHLRAKIWNLETGGEQVLCTHSFLFIQQSPSPMALRVHCEMPCVQPGTSVINVGEMAGWVEDRGIKASDHSHLIITCLVSMFGDCHSSHSQITESLNNKAALLSLLLIPLDKHTVSSALPCL